MSMPPVRSRAAVAALALWIGGGALAAPPALIAFTPLRIPDSGGAALEQAVVTVGDREYPVTLGGLGVGGGVGSEVTVTGEVYGLEVLDDLAGPYLSELASAPPSEVGSDDLWLDSVRGVSLRLHTDSAAATLAAGSDTVRLEFGWAE